VGDALLSAGVAPDRLHGRIGRAVTVDLNGETVTVKGEMGEPARILVNGEDADLSTPLEDGDRIDFVPPKDGSDARARLGDLLPDERKGVTVNGEEVFLEPVVFVDGEKVRDFDMVLSDRAKIQTFWKRPLGRLLEEAKAADGVPASRKVPYSLNGEKRELEWPPLVLEVNGEKADVSTPVGPGDVILCRENTGYPTLAELPGTAGERLEPGEVPIHLNGKPFTLRLHDRVFMNGEPAEATDMLRPGADIRVEKAEAPVLSDLFRHYDPRGDGPGKKLVMKVNDRPASFTTPLKAGDRVMIHLEEEQAG
jgi:molybdopterin converting factor small subunit